MSAVDVIINNTSRLSALVIGINEYKEFDDLEGAVPDAEDVVAYLEDCLKVPKLRIKTLFNEGATRKAIITSLRDLQHDDRINRGDPILIYYAGHGSLAKAPTHWERAGWEAGGPDIQILVPHDGNGDTIHGIPDRTIGVLLEQLAQKKGDNIVYCNIRLLLLRLTNPADRKPWNGYGSRARCEMPVEIPPELDKDIWRGNNRGAGIPQKIGLRSHVLLSACSARETAREGKGRGYFTKGLLDALRKIGAHKVTYANLVQEIEDIPEQNPQCEGHNQDRFCFDSKAPVRSSRMYHVRKVDQKYVVDAGAIHGIEEGITYSLYDDRATVLIPSPAITFEASKPEALSTTLNPLPDGPPFDITERAFAVLVRAGEEEVLRIHFTPGEKLTSIFLELAADMQIDDPAHPKFKFVKNEEAELGIAFVDNRIVFNILERSVALHPLACIPFSVPPDRGAIGLVISKAAHYFWHLLRTGGSTLLRDKVGIEFRRLEEVEEEYEDDIDLVRQPCSEDLIKDGVIDVVVEENAIYGIKITSKWKRPLYPYLFYFDNSDFSIKSYFQPPTALGKVDPPLLPGGSITIGYGSGGGTLFEFTLREGQVADVGFLKLFISTQPVDLSGIKQCSSFQPGNEQSADQGSRGLRKKERGPAIAVTWSTLQIPIIQRRDLSIQPASF